MHSEFNHISPSLLPIPWPHSCLPHYSVFFQCAAFFCLSPSVKSLKLQKVIFFLQKKQATVSLLCLNFHWFQLHSEQSPNPHKIQLSPAKSVPSCASLICLLLLPTHWLQPAWGTYCSSAKPAILVLLFILYSLCLGCPSPCSHGLLPHSQMSPSRGDVLLSFSTAIFLSSLPILLLYFSNALWINWECISWNLLLFTIYFPAFNTRLLISLFFFFALFSAVF